MTEAQICEAQRWVEPDNEFEYECRWSQVPPQGIYGISFDTFPKSSWGSWIPSRAALSPQEQEGLELSPGYKGIPGYKGKRVFYFEDLKVCHYEFSDRVEKRMPRSKRLAQDLCDDEAFGIWELKDSRWAFVSVNYNITDWCYNTYLVERIVADTLVHLVHYGLTDYQRKVLGLVPMNRSVLICYFLPYVPKDLSNIILDYLENYELEDLPLLQSQTTKIPSFSIQSQTRKRTKYVWRKKNTPRNG